MMARVAAVAALELRILARNKWVMVAISLMIGFSLLIAFAGSAPVGELNAHRLTVAAASLATLMVYLVPLIALLISYDAIAGEAARGTLALLLTYPASRNELIAGKLAAQFVVLSGAIVAGIGSAGVAIAVGDMPDADALWNAFRLAWSACLLGAAFLAVGTFVSASTREPGTAAALAIAVWIVAVVMYDVALLAALVGDDGGLFTKQVFPWLLVASPTDAFRLFNLSQIDAGAMNGGIASATGSIGIPGAYPLASLVAWPLMLAAGASYLLKRYAP